MNYLDIILWVSAVGLWVLVLTWSIEWFLKKHDQKNATMRSISDLTKEHTRLVSEHFQLKNRLDAIEKQIKKGKK